MSLLNDMLRDLSHQRQVPDGAEGYDVALLRAVSSGKQKAQLWASAILIFIVIFLSVIAARFVWHQMSVKHETVDNQQSSTVSAPEINAQFQHTAKDTLAAVIEKKSASQEKSDAPVNEETRLRIDDLLQQAERTLTMDRLTAPIEDNAYGYYQKILSIAPNNIAAKQGLNSIAERYLAKAHEQVQLGNASQAEAYFQRAKFVAPEFMRDQPGLQIANESVNEVAVMDDAHSVAAQTIPESVNETPLVVTPAPRTESIKPFSVKEANTVAITPNAVWKDEQLAQRAQELIQQGKQAEALTLLKNFVTSELKPVLSATLLIDLYLQQGDNQAAELLLTHTDYLSEVTLAKFKAQLLMVQGKDLAAITILEQYLSLADNNEPYRALLASLYHKTANYSQSIISYQRLLSSFGEKPAYWLGLALAYDGLAQHKNALQAYLHLREFPQLQEQVKTYTDQRIAALRSQ